MSIENSEDKNVKQMFEEINSAEISKDRSYFIDKAVKVEYLVNVLLSSILGISEPNKSKSFGDTTQALSFMAKVTLLNDLDFIKNDIKIKLELFASIRNKFAHLYKADSYDAAITSTKFKELEKIYKSLRNESQPDSFNKQIYVNQLVIDVEKSLENIVELALEKMVNKATIRASSQVAEHFYELISFDPRFISSRAYLKILYDKAVKEVTKEIGGDAVISLSAL